MTLAVAACVGWIAALAAAAVALGARRTLGERMEAVARASHELRGGIGAVRLGLAFATRGGDVPLCAIELELDRAALALEDLDGRRHAWAGELVDVRQLLMDSVEAWRGTAAVRNVELRLRWTGEHAVVLGDRIRLAQATGNLIANALEHGGGGVEVHGHLEGGAVKVEVTDDGPGLSAPLAELTRRARRRRERGRGRGLAIATEIARAHGGRLGAAPSERGARLVLELPAAQSLQRPSQAS